MDENKSGKNLKAIIISLIIGLVVISIIYKAALKNTEIAFNDMKRNYDEIAEILTQCHQRVDRLFVDIDTCFTSAENLGAMVDTAQKGWGCWKDSSIACYIAQDEILVFLDQAFKNMDAFYCSEELRTDEIACNIMDAYFVIIENSQEHRDTCWENSN